VTLLRSIEPNVRRAVEGAQWRGPILVVPYPGRWARNREVFLRAVVPQLKMVLSQASEQANV